MGDEEGDAPINPAAGDIYEGERNADGKRHGSGVAKYANGDVYEGAYADGARTGAGVYYFGGKDAPKAKYDGQYTANQKSGAGVLTYPDGTKVRGSSGSVSAFRAPAPARCSPAAAAFLPAAALLLTFPLLFV